MMRRALLLTVLLAGCWDFDGLQAGSGDLSKAPEDLLGADLLCRADPNLGEACSNGVDDNGDCLVDCEDPMCNADPACKVQSYGLLAASCAAGAVIPDLYASVGQSKCTRCACNGGTCAATVTVHNNAQCNGAAVATYTVPGGACQNLAPAPTNYNYKVALGAAQCAPTQAQLPPETTFNDKRSLCKPSKDCSTIACAEEAKKDLKAGERLCLVMEQMPPRCPPSFPAVVTLNRKYNETRTCTCSCAPGGACMGKLTAFPGMGCATDANIKEVDLALGGCKTDVLIKTSDMSYTPAASIRSALTGTCNGSGQLTGPAPNLSEPVTLCCSS